MLLPPAATVEEPSVLLPKENPVDMAAGSARRRQAKGSARRSRLKAQVGPAVQGWHMQSGRQEGPQGTQGSTRNSVETDGTRQSNGHKA